MNKAEAIELIGKPVEAWTAANGVYAGTLVEVVAKKGSPWRGIVKIESVWSPAQHFERGDVCRTGKRPGETIEVGGVNIKPIESVGEPVDYLEILERDLANLEARGLTPAARPIDVWAHNGFIDALKATIVAQKHAVSTGQWEWKIQKEEFRRLQNERRKGERHE